jgi:hypothetical protein
MMRTMSDFIKGNGGIIAVGVVVLAIVAGYVDIRIDAKLAAKGLVEPHEIVEVKKDVTDNTDDIDDLEDRWNRLVDALAAPQ